VKNVAYVVWEGRLLVAFGRRSADAGEWAAYAQLVRCEAVPRARILVVSHGGALEFYQRRELQDIFSGHTDRRIAVVTGSTFARGVAIAMSLIDPTYKAYPPKRLEEALEYIEVPPRARSEAKALLLDLEGRVDR
jgi:hypothetical protein